MPTSVAASALGVSIDDLRTAAAVATALAGGGKWDGTFDALEKSYLEWTDANGREPSTGSLSVLTYAKLVSMFAGQQRFASGHATMGTPMHGMRYLNCCTVVVRDVDDGVIVWE